MKLMKRLLVLVAALTMVLSLTACGESYPKKYTFSEPRGEGEQVATFIINEDGTYEYEFTATNSNGDGNIAMYVKVTGTCTEDGDTVTLDTAEGEGYYYAGTSRTDFSVTKEEPGMYAMTYAQGVFVFTVDGDTFAPVVE